MIEREGVSGARCALEEHLRGGFVEQIEAHQLELELGPQRRRHQLAAIGGAVHLEDTERRERRGEEPREGAGVEGTAFFQAADTELERAEGGEL